MGSVVVFSLPEHEVLRARLATAIGAKEGKLTVREFPDGETYVRGDTPCEGADAVLAVNLYHPNAQTLPLLFCVRAIRLMGARRVSLVAPYLPYMRQDARFQPGEVVTSRIFARLLSESFDGLVTVDPHLHRYHSLDEIYSIPSRVVHASPRVSAWIKERVPRPIIVGPDQESEQWVSQVAADAGGAYIVLTKTRLGDENVRIEVPPLSGWRGYQPVLVDDIISTGRTLLETARHLRAAGFPAPVCVGIHALFTADASAALRSAGLTKIATCNTVPHSSNEIDLTDLLAKETLELLSETSAEEATQK